MTPNFDFDQAFTVLAGFPPFAWQRRLFDEYLSSGLLPAGVDIPTGLGKTAVMAIWLLARAKQGLLEQVRIDSTDQIKHQSLPRRLVYVVDRRAVVDQATIFAEEIRDRLDSCQELEPVRRGLGLGAGQKLPISTLRGRHADNRQWMEDPSAAAIVVGTVDMVGSRLLFEGYGVSRKMRPFAAGLLGCDTLVMLDEAHLVPPFEKLLKDIEKGLNDGTFGPETETDRRIVPPFKTLPLSATARSNGVSEKSSVFSLQSDDRKDKTVEKRLSAKKRLGIIESEDLVPELADRAWKLGSELVPKRVLVYCNSREDALKVKADIDKRLKQHDGETELLVGARRVREREGLANWLKEKGFLGDVNGPPEHSLFLIATSAGEVGVDLDADHMVCDLVEWERMAQRFGRVNRRGNGDAKIIVVAASSGRKSKEAEVEERLGRLRKPLDALRANELEGARDASPDAILNLKARARNDQRLLTAIDEATTLEPLRPAVTRPLVDAWAMTSLIEHAGRPEVEPWLRGWKEDDQFHTTIVWRQFLPLRFSEGELVPSLTEKEVTEFFEAAPLHTIEMLETETYRVGDWLRKRARQIDKIKVGEQSGIGAGKREDENEEEENTFDELHLFASRARAGAPIALVLGNDATYVDQLSVRRINSLDSRSLARMLANRKLVVDACVGGLRDGLLDANCREVVPEALEELASESIQEAGLPSRRVRRMSNDERREERRDENQWREAAAFPHQVNSEGEPEHWLVVEKWQGEQSNEDGRGIAKTKQSLIEHQEWVADEAKRIAKRLGLLQEDSDMLAAAAQHHDDGKNAQRWQRAFNAPVEGGPYAKTGGPFNKYVLNGYRHELQSVIDAESRGLNGIEPTDSRFDLALHLIAAHHGNARPALSIEGLDSLSPTAATHCARDIAVRFARLQRRWGPWGLAWWESLLRAADQSASRMLDEAAGNVRGMD